MNFCKKNSTVVTPLPNLLSPKQTFAWTEECQLVFENVKALMCNSPVLAGPQFKRAFKLEVDASAVGVEQSFSRRAQMVWTIQGVFFLVSLINIK